MDLKKYNKIVKEGYEKVYGNIIKDKDYYARNDDHSSASVDVLFELLDVFLLKIPAKIHILDAGCGNGRIARILVDRGYNVTGIDISENAVKLAKQNIQNAEFQTMDMAAITLPSARFDAIYSSFAVIHVKRELHKKVFEGFYRILRSGGKVFMSIGPDSGEYLGDYFGYQMAWSHWAPETTQELLTDVGFQVITNEHVEMGSETHNWVLAKK
jgi:SAM-dependent methyltransferase